MLSQTPFTKGRQGAMPEHSRVRLHARRENASFAWTVTEELAEELRPRLESEGWTVTITPEELGDPSEGETPPDVGNGIPEEPAPKPPHEG
jgi:hypothetical protein